MISKLSEARKYLFLSSFILFCNFFNSTLFWTESVVTVVVVVNQKQFIIIKVNKKEIIIGLRRISSYLSELQKFPYTIASTLREPWMITNFYPGLRRYNLLFSVVYIFPTFTTCFDVQPAFQSNLSKKEHSKTIVSIMHKVLRP